VPFTAAGVGDMSGDVFGNGMLLSPVTRLVAAFDHRDIFIDPDPDPAKSFAERARLFALPRSSWADYDRALISRGGGIFPRSLKAIALTAEMRALLDLDQDSATPQEVMTAILKARVDLLWFGGIGTYIRAGDETDAMVGDRANDAIRITGAAVRAHVIGEGANLGATQRGRIEAARGGVRLNTDAIDNSAGVNTSDVEVNIKIALSLPERDGRLDMDARNALLADMTDEVAGLVLRNNYLQSLALSLAERRGASEIALARTQMRLLEQAGRLDRAVEFLPDDGALMAREQRGEGLTRPEIAVLLAYAKLSLFDDLIASGIPDEPYLAGELERYFPRALRERFPDAVTAHRLRREIVATQLGNALINRGGPTIVARLMDETGADGPTIARAYILTRDVFGLLDLNLAIDRLDGRVPGGLQLSLYALVQDMLGARMAWFLRHTDVTQPLDALVRRFRPGVESLTDTVAQLIGPAARVAREDQLGTLVAAGVPAELATRLVDLRHVEAASEGTVVAEQAGVPVAEAVAALFAAQQMLDLDRLRLAALKLVARDRYERLANDRAGSRLDAALRGIAVEVARGGAGPTSGMAESAGAWAQARGPALTRSRRQLDDILEGGLTSAKLTVAATLFEDLAAGAV
jgi:glutamate dehydrogenase